MDLIEWTERAVPAAFDYSSLDPAVAFQVRASANRIKEQRKKQHARLLETGRELLTVKNQLGHGSFGPWLEAELAMSERTAQRYMKAAEVFGDKPEFVSALPQTVIVELAAPSTPERVREMVLERIGAQEQIRPIAVLAMVKAAREAERRVKEEEKRTAALASMSPEERKALEQKEKRQRTTAQQRAEASWRRLLDMEAKEAKKLDAALEAVALLKSRMSTDELARLSRLVGAARSAFDGLLADAAGLRPNEHQQQWVHMAHSRAPTEDAKLAIGE